MVIQPVNMEIFTSTHWDFTGKMGIEVTIRQAKTQWQRGISPTSGRPSEAVPIRRTLQPFTVDPHSLEPIENMKILQNLQDIGYIYP
jgi:hypothetical protein